MSRLLSTCAPLLLLASTIACLAADSKPPLATPGEWPQWRGPNRDDVSTETGLLESWEAAPPQLAWKATGLGEGFSSVSIAGGRIFTMGDRNGGQHVMALSLADGKELWATKIGPTHGTNYSGPRCTPTVDLDRVYAVGTSGDLACLDAKSGKLRWAVNFARDFGGKMMSGWAYSESPLVDGNLLVCTPGAANAGIVALNKLTGKTVWASEIPPLGDNGKDGAAYSSIVVSMACGVKQYVQLMGRGVVGVDAKTGTFLWGYNKVANSTANIPTPIVKGDYVFASTGYRTGAALLHLKKSGPGIEAKEVYFLDSETFQNHHGGMVLLGDYLYGGTGHNKGFPICLEFMTGKVMWGGKTRSPGSDSAAVTYADGNMYFRYQDGTMALIGATPDGYKLKGTFKIPDCTKPSWPHPVVAGGKLYLREQDTLLCYDVKK